MWKQHKFYFLQEKPPYSTRWEKEKGRLFFSKLTFEMFHLFCCIKKIAFAEPKVFLVASRGSWSINAKLSSLCDWVQRSSAAFISGRNKVRYISVELPDEERVKGRFRFVRYDLLIVEERALMQLRHKRVSKLFVRWTWHLPQPTKGGGSSGVWVRGASKSLQQRLQSHPRCSWWHIAVVACLLVLRGLQNLDSPCPSLTVGLPFGRDAENSDPSWVGLGKLKVKLRGFQLVALFSRKSNTSLISGSFGAE